MGSRVTAVIKTDNGPPSWTLQCQDNTNRGKGKRVTERSEELITAILTWSSRKTLMSEGRDLQPEVIARTVYIQQSRTPRDMNQGSVEAEGLIPPLFFFFQKSEECQNRISYKNEFLKN